MATNAVNRLKEIRVQLEMTDVNSDALERRVLDERSTTFG